MSQNTIKYNKYIESETNNTQDCYNFSKKYCKKCINNVNSFDDYIDNQCEECFKMMNYIGNDAPPYSEKDLKNIVNNNSYIYKITNKEHYYFKYNYNKDYFKCKILEFFNDSEKFMNIINSSKNISISGSFILETINNKSFETINDKKDIDIYINIMKFNNGEIKSLLTNMLEFLNSEGYIYVKNITNRDQIDQIDPFNLNKINNNKSNNFLNKYYTKEDRFIYKEHVFNYIYYAKILKKYDGYMLNKFLLDYFKFENKDTKKSIEIMFINLPISVYMVNTFDISIVKNYYCQGDIKVYSLSNLKDKVGIINYTHFYKRILNNLYEFNNFLIRYNKYISRGYTIKIENVTITKDIINNIENIYINYKHIFSTNSLYSKMIICTCVDDKKCKHIYKHYKSYNTLCSNIIMNKIVENANKDVNDRTPDTILMEEIEKLMLDKKLQKLYRPSYRSKQTIMYYLCALKLNEYSKYNDKNT